MTSQRYALSLSNKSAIDLRIWKEYRFQNTLQSDHDFEIMMSVDAVWDTDLIQDAADPSLSDVKNKTKKTN